MEKQQYNDDDDQEVAPPAEAPNPATAMGVAALAQAYRDGSVTPTQAVEACLDAYARLDDKLHAWQNVDAEGARRAAAAATAQFASRGDISSLPVFLGIPFGLKDLVDMEGFPTGKGSVARVAVAAASSAPITKCLLASGGIYMGKLNTVEFATGAWGTNESVGAPVNPWSRDKPLACGGSSSGSGVAVASGMLPCAVGTDTGGSVRVPAAFCGIVGLKTTKDLLSTDGIHPLSHTFDTPGPLARSVEDCALMCAAMMPSSEAASFSAACSSSMRAGVHGLRLACMGERGRSLVTDASQLSAFDAALDVLRSLGAEVTTFDWDVTSTVRAKKVISISEGYYHNREVVEDPDSKMDEAVRVRHLLGKEYTAFEYIAASMEREAVIPRWHEGMGECVAWLSPATTARPIPLEDVDEVNSNGLSLTGFVNHLGLCAISVPTGPMEGSIDEGALPTSLQITCKGGGEAMALRIAKAYESARGPLTKPPIYAL